MFAVFLEIGFKLLQFIVDITEADESHDFACVFIVHQNFQEAFMAQYLFSFLRFLHNLLIDFNLKNSIAIKVVCVFMQCPFRGNSEETY